MILELVAYLVFIFFAVDFIRKHVLHEDDGDTNIRSADREINSFPIWKRDRVQKAFYDRQKFRQLTRDEKIMSTYMYCQSKIEPITFRNYVFWGLDYRFRTEYLIRLIITGILVSSMLIMMDLPWKLNVFFVTFWYLGTDFLSYLSQRVKKVTQWDPEWSKHDELREGRILDM